MPTTVYDKDGNPGTLGYDREGNPKFVPLPQSVEKTPWFDRPLWQSKVPMAVGQTGPSTTAVIDALPAIGGAVGGVVGGGGLGAMTAGTASVPGALGGAAVGGATGELARQGLRYVIGARVPETPFEAGTNVLRESAGQTLAEGLGQGVSMFARSAAAPGRSALDPAVEAASARLARAPGGAGLEMPASARTTSRPVAYVEGYAAEGFGGAGAADRIRRSASHLTAIADHTVARASALQTPLDQGAAIFQGMRAFKDAWMQQKNALYREVEKDMPWGWVQLPKTTELVQQAAASQRSARRVLGGTEPNERFFEETLDKLTKVVEQNGKKVRVLKNVRIGDLENATHKLDAMVAGSYADPFSAGNAGFLKKLSATMDEELIAAIRQKNPQTADKLLNARAAYEDGISKINSSFGELIWKLGREEKYDLIALGVANRRMSLGDIPKVMEVAGPEGTDAMRTAVLADLVNKAKGLTREGGEVVLTPKGLEQAGKNFGWDRLRAILTPEQYQTYRDLATTSGALERVTKIIHGSPTAGKLRWAGYGGAGLEIAKGVAGAASAHPYAALAYLLGDTGISRFVSSEAGQRWLTTGFPRVGAYVGAAATQGPRTAIDYFRKEE